MIYWKHQIPESGITEKFVRVCKDPLIPSWNPNYLLETALKINPLFSDGCSESGTVWGLSWKVTGHVVTYIESLVCHPNILSVALGGLARPGVVQSFCEFSLPIAGVIRLVG